MSISLPLEGEMSGRPERGAKIAALRCERNAPAVTAGEWDAGGTALPSVALPGISPTKGGDWQLQRRALTVSSGLLIDGLEHHAVALGQLDECVDALLRFIGVETEIEPDGAEADRRILCHAQRAAKIEIAFGLHRGGAEPEFQRCRHRLQRNAGASHQRLQQHVARAQFETRAAGGRMQPGDGKRPARLDLAGDRLVVDRAFGAKRDQRLRGVVAIGLLQRRLHGFQSGGVHF